MVGERQAMRRMAGSITRFFVISSFIFLVRSVASTISSKRQINQLSTLQLTQQQAIFKFLLQSGNNKIVTEDLRLGTSFTDMLGTSKLPKEITPKRSFSSQITKSFQPGPKGSEKALGCVEVVGRGNWKYRKGRPNKEALVKVMWTTKQ